MPFLTLRNFFLSTAASAYREVQGSLCNTRGDVASLLQLLECYRKMADLNVRSAATIASGLNYFLSGSDAPPTLAALNRTASYYAAFLGPPEDNDDTEGLCVKTALLTRHADRAETLIRLLGAQEFEDFATFGQTRAEARSALEQLIAEMKQTAADFGALYAGFTVLAEEGDDAPETAISTNHPAHARLERLIGLCRRIERRQGGGEPIDAAHTKLMRLDLALRKAGHSSGSLARSHFEVISVAPAP